MPGLILAIETSQRDGAVALLSPPTHIDVEDLVTASRHDDDLVPAIDRLVRRANAGPSDLAGVGVSVGPGGFTGLRIAIASVKMLALTLGIRVIAVPTALVVAESLDDAAANSMLVTLASKRETFWATRVVRANAIWSPDGPGALVTAETVDLNSVDVVVADEHLPEPARTRITEAGLDLIPPRFDARACLAITQRWLGAGQTTDPHALAPLYPRLPEAVVKWRERSG